MSLTYSVLIRRLTLPAPGPLTVYAGQGRVSTDSPLQRCYLHEEFRKLFRDCNTQRTQMSEARIVRIEPARRLPVSIFMALLRKGPDMI